VEPDGRQVYMLNKGDLAEAYEIKVNQVEPCTAIGEI
jgi:hypothetical protein